MFAIDLNAIECYNAQVLRSWKTTTLTFKLTMDLSAGALPVSGISSNHPPNKICIGIIGN